MYEAITIKADGRILRIEMKKQPTLDFIQQAVGGSIEMVPYFIKYEGRPVTVVYANEEARRMTLEFNTLATQAWLSCIRGGPKRHPSQLFGDILIVMRMLNA
jgi:hypothetical protein